MAEAPGHSRPLPADQFDPRIAIGDLQSRRLLIVATGEVLLIWSFAGRVGFVEKFSPGRPKWVWFSAETTAHIKSYTGPEAGPNAPDFQLSEWR